MIEENLTQVGRDPRSNLSLIFLSFLLLSAGAMAQGGGSSELDDPDAEVDPRFEEARLLNVDGEFEAAWAIYDKILADRGHDVPTLITYGNMKWRAGDKPGAEEKLKLAIQTMPSHIKAQQFLGQLYFFQGKRKLARERFEYMKTLKFMREDVMHSAILNLGKMDLLEENWRAARKHFKVLRRDGGKADRKSGNRGNRLLKMMGDLDEWPRMNSRHLYAHFSPDLKQFTKIADRKKYVEELDRWIDKVVAFLGIAMPDPWHLYVFENDDEAGIMTGRVEAHGWDSSWWLSYTAVDSPYSAKHTLAVQLCSRWGGSRPMSRSLVEGFCEYLADEGKDPHREAVKMFKANSLPSILKLHEHQRRNDQFGTGISYVDFMIRTYGIEKFKKLWLRLNIEVNLRKYKVRNLKKIKFDKAFEGLYTKTLGVSFDEFEKAWRSKVARVAGGGK